MLGLDLGNLVAHINLDTTQFDIAVKRVGSQMKSLGDKMSKVGKDLTTKVTLPLLGIGTAAVKTSTSLESAFIGVRKTVNATEKEFQALKYGFDEMSTRIPLAVEELYALGEAAGQLGIQNKNILGFSETMANLGATTDLSSQQAAIALARFANITQMPQKNFDRLGSTIVELGNTFAAFESEITEMGLRMASAGKLAGMSVAEIQGIATAFISVGVEAQRGGTAFQKVVQNMIKAVSEGNEQLTMFAETSGVTAKEFAEVFKKDSAQAFQIFVEGLGKTGDRAFTILDKLGLEDQRLMQAFTSLAGAGDLLNNTIDVGTRAWEENVALTEEAIKRYGSAASKFRLIWNEIRLSIEPIGKVLGNILLEFYDTRIKPLVQWFRTLNEETQRLIVRYGIYAAALGPVLLITGKLLTSIGFMTLGLHALTRALIPVIASITALAVPIASVIGVVLLLAASFYTLRAAWNQGVDVIRERLQALGGYFQQTFQYMKELVGETVINIVTTFYDMFTQIKKGWQNMSSDLYASMAAGIKWMDNIKNGIVKAWTDPSITGAINQFKNGFKKANSEWANDFVNSWESSVPVIDDFKKRVQDGYETTALYIQSYGEATKEHLSELGEALKKQFGEDVSAVIDMINSKIIDMDKLQIDILPEEDMKEVTESIKIMVNELNNLQVNNEALDALKQQSQDMLAAIQEEIDSIPYLNQGYERSLDIVRMKNNALAQAQIIYENIADAAEKEALIQAFVTKQVDLYKSKLKELQAIQKGGSFDRWIQESKDLGTALEENVVSGLDQLSSTFSDFIVNGETDWKQFTGNILKMFLDSIIKMQIAAATAQLFDQKTGIITKLVTSAVSSLGSLGSSSGDVSLSDSGISSSTMSPGATHMPGYALGGVFWAGNIIPYALGGLMNSIVNTPVYAPMSGNNTALIGEAGPEAVMPLTRDSSGRLGVKSKNDNAKIENKLKIVNVYDKEQMLAAMNTDKGEKMVMNILKKNGVI